MTLLCVGLLILLYNEHTREHRTDRRRGEGERSRSPDSPVRDRYTRVTVYCIFQSCNNFTSIGLELPNVSQLIHSHLCYYYYI